jgi:hypothetical protein
VLGFGLYVLDIQYRGTVCAISKCGLTQIQYVYACVIMYYVLGEVGRDYVIMYVLGEIGRYLV